MYARFPILVFTLLAISANFWTANDPLTGTWKLNLAKSTYAPWAHAKKLHFPNWATWKRN